MSPESLLRALRLGLAPLVFWQVTKRERKVFEADLTPEKLQRVTKATAETKPDKSHDTKSNDDASGWRRSSDSAHDGGGKAKESEPLRATRTAAEDSASVRTSRHVAELETPLGRTPGQRGGVMIPEPWWSRVRSTGQWAQWGFSYPRGGRRGLALTAGAALAVVGLPFKPLLKLRGYRLTGQSQSSSSSSSNKSVIFFKRVFKMNAAFVCTPAGDTGHRVPPQRTASHTSGWLKDRPK